MILNRTIEELKSFDLGQNNILDNYNLIKKYFHKRFQQDRETAEFNKKIQVINQELLELISGACVSPRRINSAIKMFKSFNQDIHVEESVENIFQLIVSNIDHIYAQYYYEYRNNVEKYIETKLKIKERKEQFKQKKKLALKELRLEVYEEGLIPSLLNDMYSIIKKTFNNLAWLPCWENEKFNLEQYRENNIFQYRNSIELLMTDVFLEELKNVHPQSEF